MTIKVAIIGVGNSASSFVQGLKYYRERRDGLWHERVSGYGVEDVEVVAAFDVDRRKVGKDLADAIFSEPNRVKKYVEIDRGIEVKPGLLLDRLPEGIRMELVSVGPEEFSEELKRSGADIALNLINSFMPDSSKAYAEACLSAGCSFLNATPAYLARDDGLVKRYEEAKVLLLGDNLMSQLGGTIFHKGIIDFIQKRGLKLVESYQLDVSGGLEGLAVIDERTREVKRRLKADAINVELRQGARVEAGTVDYVEYMGNNRTSYFWLSAEGFLGERFTLDVYLRTNDGANAGNVLLDLVRAAYGLMNKGIYGAPDVLCNYGFKNTRKPVKQEEALRAFEAEFCG